jgi:glycosyltransferase involved in cell wall biosynthesis
MNGIPIVTTGNGNIRLMLGDAGIYVDAKDITGWVKTINGLYNNKTELLRLSKKITKRYEQYSHEVAQSQFDKLCLSTLLCSKLMNIMFFVCWCDQGLGIQVRNYTRVLKENGFNVSIFSYNAYNCDNGTHTAQQAQTCPSEWKIPGVSVYYSTFHRESVSDEEIENFVQVHNVGKCVIPETCWYRVFEIARLLGQLGVRTYAVPNIEIVRKDEIHKHHFFDRVLCNNLVCKDIFESYGFRDSIRFIGYAADIIEYPKECLGGTGKIRFLFLGGRNAVSRKQINEVSRAFADAARKVDNIELTLCFQTEQLGLNIEQHPSIHVNNKSLSYEEVLMMYRTHHVFIQPSKQEGLGLGFYEALAMGTPVLTINTAPHNEIIRDGINGWVIDCTHEPMTDNDNGVIMAACFEVIDMSNKLVELAVNFPRSIYKSLRKDFQKRLSMKKFCRRLVSALMS